MYSETMGNWRSEKKHGWKNDRPTKRATLPFMAIWEVVYLLIYGFYQQTEKKRWSYFEKEEGKYTKDTIGEGW